MRSIFERGIFAMCFIVAMCASQYSFAEDCGKPNVKLGEVMAGFQAGLTGGAHTEVGNPAGLFIAVGGDDRRGFIVPENLLAPVSEQCENDHILVSGWVACGIETADGTKIRKPKEAKECAAQGLFGLIVGQRFELDGAVVEHMDTSTKIGHIPSGTRVAFITSGFIIEPYALDLGLHTAVVVYELDGDADGIADQELPFTADFLINAAN